MSSSRWSSALWIKPCTCRGACIADIPRKSSGSGEDAPRVFNLPGLGRLTVDAVLARDYPVIQGVILLFSAVYILINLVVDVSYTIFDPRNRY